MQLREAVSVAPRFARAVNLERDFGNPLSLDGYSPTSTVLDALHRIAEGLDRPGHRAWTLIGPYGTGKSAFALFLASLLGVNSESRQLANRQLRKPQGGGPGPRPSGGQRLWPILVVGSRRPLATAVLEGCLHHLPKSRTSPLRGVQRTLGRLLAASQRRDVEPDRVVSAVQEVVDATVAAGLSQGGLLVIDELGKLLEYAAQRPDLSDVHLLQALAEATAGTGSSRLAVITILHQGFDAYLGEARQQVREEWGKVQGRYEDIAFVDPPEELLHLLSEAITRRSARANNEILALHEHARCHARTALELGLVPQTVSPELFAGLLAKCAPLHPAAALTLVRLCKKFGQNHRSLFSFLTSFEPHGFQEYLRDTSADADMRLYGLADLYDYIASALGNSLLAGEASSRWADVQTALDRCSDRPAEEIVVLKAVGLLSAIGVYGALRASREIVAFATQLEAPVFDRALSGLVDSGVLVLRKHTGTYAFWQGTDVDLTERFAEARTKVAAHGDIARRLNRQVTARPIVAKRHSYETGALRYFAVRYIDSDNYSEVVNGVYPDQADGLLGLVLPRTPADRDEILARVTSAEVQAHRGLVFGIAPDSGGIEDLLTELERWVWVSVNTSELSGDAAARREVNIRISILHELIRREVAALFEPKGTTMRRATWVSCGEVKKARDDRSLAQLLSDVCDSVYHSSPLVRNELINRRVLSSAAAAARRNLIEAMLTSADRPRLGLEGYGPEVSLYESVLRKPGIHRPTQSGVWRLTRPREGSPVLPLWKDVETFLDSCESERGAVSDVFRRMAGAPFGVPQGLAPLLFLAVLLVRGSEAALYEEGTFLPEITVDGIERLLRQPEKFEVRTFAVRGSRRLLHEELSTLLLERGGMPQRGAANLVAIVRSLYKRLNSLEPYSKQTRQLTDRAQKVRHALLAAREPDALLFVDLPDACGFKGRVVDRSTAVEFEQALDASLRELQNAYAELLATLTDLLFKACGVFGEEGRAVLRRRATRVASIPFEPRTKGLAALLADERLTADKWIEALATMITGRPPRVWNDADRSRFEHSVVQAARSFRHAEVIASVECVGGDGRDGTIVRLGVTGKTADDLEVVLTIPQSAEPELADATRTIRQHLEHLSSIAGPDIALAAVGLATRPMMIQMLGRPGIRSTEEPNE